jgi:hypothetical protein
MPAGRGNACLECYWRATYLRRLKLDEAGLSSSQFVLLFRAFGAWLLEQVPPQKAALTIHGYFPFFYEMEKKWGKIPGYSQLLIHFTAEGLRRVRLPMRWLSETAQVVVVAKEREDASELRRIEALVASIPAGTPASTVLNAYKTELQAKSAAGRTSIRTVRLSLRPAISLLISCDESGLQLPNQSALDRYLLNTPGQKASITGFVTFINNNHGTGLVIRLDKQRTQSRRHRQLEGELAALLAQKERDDGFKNQWISVSLAYFHGLAPSVSRNLKKATVSTDNSGFLIETNGKTYWVPHWNYHPEPAVR